MEFRILGPLEALADGRPLDLGGHKQRALLACLLLEANRVVPADRLLAALWEEEPPETGRKALQVYVSKLRALLGRERIVTRAPGYLLRLEEGELDLERFQGLRARGRPAQALALWRGPPLADLAYDRFFQADIARLEELRLACLEERLDQDLAAGRHGELVGELEALVGEHPLRERLRGQLMLALYRSGRQAEALEAYQQARRALTEELGLEPGKELRALQQAILRQDAALDRVPPADGQEPWAVGSGGAFVGRERELAELQRALEEALAGHGRLVLLSGDPGIGKTRLAEELARAAGPRGVQVLWGRCWEEGGAPAYWPWVQALRPLVEEADPGQVRRWLGVRAADLSQLLPELRELLGDLPEPSAVASDVGRFRLFDAVDAFLAGAAQRRPVLVVLDDLHAADEPSLLLLRFIAAEIGRSRLLLMCLFRDVEPTLREPLVATVAELLRVPHARHMALAGLSEQDVSRYVELARGISSPLRLVRAIHAATEGNPLFVAEVVRLLGAEGRLVDADAHVRVPPGIQAVIERRLGRLSERCRHALAAASVLGREFRVDALAELLSVEALDLLEILDEALSERVLGGVPGVAPRLRFSHALIRDAMYEGLTPVQRMQLHRAAGEALEVVYQRDPEPYLAELAHHFVAAAPAAADRRAVDYARRAGDRALAQLAYEQAVVLYGMALQAMDSAPSPDDLGRCEFLLAMAEAQTKAADTSAAQDTALAAADLARRIGSPKLLARAALAYGGRPVWSAGPDRRLVALLEEGLAAVGDRDAELRSRLLARLAAALRDQADREPRAALSEEAVATARHVADPMTLAYALEGRLAAIWWPGSRWEERLRLSAELIELAERMDDRERAFFAHGYRMYALMEMGEMAAAYEELEARRRIAQQPRQPSLLWLLAANSGLRALFEGRLEDAEGHVSRVVSLGERAQRVESARSALHQLLILRREQGRLGELEDLLARPDEHGLGRWAIAFVHAELGHEAQARTILDAVAREAFAEVPHLLEWLLAMCLLAETCAPVGAPEHALALYRALAAYAGVNVVSPPEVSIGAASRYLGLLASTLERWDEAAEHLDAALEMNARMGARPWLAHTQEDYARMLLARDGPGDAERAGELLDQALAMYRQLGMEASAAKASALAAGRIGV